MVLDDLRGGGEERLVGAPAHQRVAVVRGRRGVPHEGGRHVPAARDARVERLKWMDKLLETNTDVHAYNDTLGDQTRVSLYSAFESDMDFLPRSNSRPLPA